MYYVYLLKSLKDNKYYIGQTKDVVKRLKRHNSGQVRSTKFRTPLELIGCQPFSTRNEARWIEYNLKNHSDKKKKFIRLLENERPPAPEGLWPGGGVNKL